VDPWLRSKGAGTRSPKERRPRRSSPTLVPRPGASADRKPGLCRNRRSSPVLRRSPTPASTPARAPHPTRPPSPASPSTLNLLLRVRRVLWQLRGWTWGEPGRRRDRATATPRLARGPVGLRTRPRPRTRPRLRGTSRSFASRRNRSLRLSLRPPRSRLPFRPSATQRGPSLPFRLSATARGTSLHFRPRATRGRRCAHLPRSGPGSGASRSALARVARAHRTGQPRAQRPERTGPPRMPQAQRPERTGPPRRLRALSSRSRPPSGTPRALPSRPRLPPSVRKALPLSTLDWAPGGRMFRLAGR